MIRDLYNIHSVISTYNCNTYRRGCYDNNKRLRITKNKCMQRLSVLGLRVAKHFLGGNSINKKM